MITCENCNKEHNGSYGSGRFCDEKCARTYSANINKEQKGKKISEAMKKRWKNGPHINPEKFKGMIKNAHKAYMKKIEILYKTGKWEDLSLPMKQKRLLEEQQGKCSICEIDTWLGSSLMLQFHHINGNRKDNSRKNVSYLCPNCHSQTATYCKNKIYLNLSI